MKNIDVKELIQAMDELEKEKGISKKYLIDSLQAALEAALEASLEAIPSFSFTLFTIFSVNTPSAYATGTMSL